MNDELKKAELDEESLSKVSGGAYEGQYGYVCGLQSGFLALRTACAYDDSNIIGELYNGDDLEFRHYGYGDYIYVFAPKYGMTGYVNGNFTSF